MIIPASAKVHFPTLLKPAMSIPSRRLAFPALSSTLLLTGMCLAQTTERVSVDSFGVEENGPAHNSSISADGRYVAFQSDASNLVADTNMWAGIFVHDRQTGVMERVSVGMLGTEGNGYCWALSISTDGRYVAFDSEASNFVWGDTNGTDDVFVHDRQTGVTERVSMDSLGTQGDSLSRDPSISADGRYVAFVSWSHNLVAGDTNLKIDIFVHDRQTGVTERVSVDSLGNQGNDHSWRPSISADGRYVAFDSDASNLVSGDTNTWADIFVHDRQTGVTERVSVDSLGAEGYDDSLVASISADGRFVAFQSSATGLVPGDTNWDGDIFVHDRQTGVTERVSVNSFGVQGNNASNYPSISADGRYVAFDSRATDLVPGDSSGETDVFVHDRQTGVTERVSVDSFGAQGNDTSNEPSLSADGRYVAFKSMATDLVPGDSNGAPDIFVHDRWSGLGENSIYLYGHSTASVQVPLELSWRTTRGNSRYWLVYSRNLNGAVVGGHNFDIGYPGIILATGTNGTNGKGSFTSAPVPSNAAGFTIYFEVTAMDADGILYDSNVHAVTFY